MLKYSGLGTLFLIVIVFISACDSERYSPTVPVDPPEQTVDTLIVIHYDTMYVVVNDSTADTVFVSCDTCAFEDCKTLGKKVHKVMWFKDDIMVVIGSENPHAFGHDIYICITMRPRDGEYDITLSAWRGQVRPNQTLDVFAIGQLHVWSLGRDHHSSLRL